MKQWIMRLSLIAMIFGSPQLWASMSVAWDEGKDEWKTRSSEHFEIHYLSEFDAMAQRSLAIAERVHKDLVPYFKRAPRAKTQMVLIDEFDFSNGWATPFPYNQIRLFVTPPEDIEGLEHMDEWLHGLIRHEYVHILQMDYAAGVPGALQKVFGRVSFFFPHMLSPSFLLEGLAVYLETDYTIGYGRLDSSYYGMQMRAEIMHNGGDSINQVILPQRDWPQGKHYLYGAYFWTYIGETYGDEKIQQYIAAYSRQILPFFMHNTVSRRVFGKSFAAIWDDFLVWNNKKFEQQIAQLQQNYRGGNPLASLPNTQQVTATSGQALWQVEANGEDRPHFVRWLKIESQQQNTQWQKELFEQNESVLDMDIAADGTFAITRLIPRASGRAFADLYLWSEQNGWTDLTNKMRFTKVRWLPNDEQMIAARKEKGVSEFWLVDRKGNAQLLWQGDALNVVGGFDISPNGQFLVASVKRERQGWNLERFDLASKNWSKVTDSKAIEHQPEFLADGRLLFSADYQGVFNIYRLDLNSQRIEQLTSVVTGAFQPRMVNNDIVFQEYTAEGFALKTLPVQTLNQFSVASVNGRYDYPPSFTQTVTSTERAYSPWSTLRPRYWMPYLVSDEYSNQVGIATGGWDALARHNYMLEAYWDFKNDWAGGSFTYSYDNRWQLQWRRSFSNDEIDNNNDNPLIEREDLLVLQRDHIWNAMEDELQIRAGISHQFNKFERLPAGITATNLKQSLVGVALSLNDFESYRNVLGTGWGSNIDIIVESNDVLDSDYEGMQIQTQLANIFDLPGRSTIAVSLYAGYGEQGIQSFTIGGSADRDEGLIFGRNELSLAGYEREVQAGDRYYLASAQFNGWLTRIEKNWGFIPLGLGDIGYNAWVKSGSAWSDDVEHKNLTSVGVGLLVELGFAYNAVIPLNIGLAQGLDSDLGKTQFYVNANLAF